MTNNSLNEKVIKSLCREFQSVWMINVKDLSITIFSSNAPKAVRNSIEIAQAMKNYETARKWYINNIVFEPDRPRMIKQTSMEAILEGTESDKEYYVEYNRLNNGELNFNQLCYYRIESESGDVEHVLMGFRDIEIRKKAERDALTGLYTRQVFLEKAEKLIADNPDIQYDLMLSDIVDFKEINENYGIPVGDEILKWSASILAPLISDTFIAGRYGGDQFVLMTTHEHFLKMENMKTTDQFEAAEKANGLPSVAVKFGVFEDVRKEKTVISACDKAHIAINTIKSQYDKKKVYYGKEIANELIIRRKIENTMHQALKERQFEVYYQPKHDAVTGNLVGAEALIRWNHPEFGFMSPGEFIPVFEKNGFITEIDKYVWNRTCENLRRWEDEGYRTVPVSVNASKLSFEQPDLLRNMQAAVDKYHVSPKQLHIEITETLMSENISLLKRKLSAIKAIGYQVDLDDFGAGYSSVHALSSLPLDVVKLDMSFIKQYDDVKRSKVLAACINLAKELGYVTVSEGVEHKEQIDMLCILGVDIIQGFFYSKPLPEKEFEEYMEKYS